MNEENKIDDAWLLETVERLPKHNWMYKLMCILTFRPFKKFSYQQLYMFFMALNFKEVTDVEADKKEAVMLQILDIYRFNNNKLPFDLDD